ncbi:uncharacterized protein LOC132751898 [Ruditapes philippinarum]|uniref:uncharacterized protein LOC132751898 n=1 Tax=Ruditapes philippinarum TaxID=129788 RepID=UPI00295C24D5|nr:uncharacterized protein LOC132751898 [Ruditapes philippinarum]
MWFLVDQMTSRGYTQHFATSLLSVLGFANLVGRILGIMVKLRKHSCLAVYNMFYVCPILAVAHVLVILLQRLGRWMYAACTVHGVAFGLLNVFAPVIIYDLSDKDKFQQAVSQLNLTFGVANLLSNFIGGIIRDIYGNYDMAYKLGVTAAIIVTLGFVIIAKETRKRDMERKSFITEYNEQVTKYKSIN